MLGESTLAHHGTLAGLADGGALDPLVAPQCSLAVQLRRATGAIIGRGAKLEAISQELREASRHLAVTLEGEPGIGKHRISGLQSAMLKGLSEPIEVVNVDWR